MAIFMMRDAAVTVNSVALSTYGTDIALNIGVAELDATAFGATTQINLAGLINWSASMTFNQDFALSTVDATLFPLIGAAAFTILMRATSSANSTTNPQYSGLAILTSYTPITGKVGELLAVSAEFKSAGPLSRLTT